MDKGTLFLALVVMVAAIGIGLGVWWHYSDIAPERAMILDDAAANTANQEMAALASGDLMTVKAFFGNTKLASSGKECDTVFALDRRVPKSNAVARAALSELLKGVTAEEEAMGYLTSINYGAKLQDLKLENGVLRADFSAALDEGVGGACRVGAIRKQIEETARQFPTVKEVVISVDGQIEDILQP